CGLFRRRKLPLWQRNPSLLRHHPNRLGKRHILNLAYKREHVARNPAAKAMEELPHGMHRKRRRFFLVKWTQAGIVLRPGLAQPDVSLDDFDDIDLLLYGLGKIGHGGLVLRILPAT